MSSTSMRDMPQMLQASRASQVRVINPASPATARLVETPEGLTLTDGTLELRADLTKLLPRIKPGRVESELLVKAVRVKGVEPARTLVVDATAGLGEDALLLAAAGFEVVLFERDPVIAALLRDAMVRAGERPELAGCTSRMKLCEEDSIPVLQGLACDVAPGQMLQRRPDVVVLDPMFPERTKSASVKKKFQLLHLLEEPCRDEETLLDAALAAALRKVVVKRPPKGPHLAGHKPAYSLQGKAVRYDVIVL